MKDQNAESIGRVGPTGGGPVVVILDSSPVRRELLRKAMPPRAIVVDETVIGPGPVALCLRHFGDQGVAPDLVASKVIFYGGSGGNDSRCIGDPERIWRPVTDNAGLTPQEAASLLEYACGESEKPAILIRSTAVLAALAILAQGYLAVHAEQIGGKWGPPAIAEALEAMEWGKYAQTTPSRDWSPGLRDAVRNPSWWQSTFGQVDNLVARALAEWGPADTHRPALEALAQNIAQGRPIDETTVAKAYFALRQRLGRPYRGQ